MTRHTSTSLELVERITKLEEEAEVHKMPVFVRVRTDGHHNTMLLLDAADLVLHRDSDGTCSIRIDLT